MRDFVRRMVAFVTLASLVACADGNSLVRPGPSSPPRAGAPSGYIGTFPLTYTGPVGSCGSSALPTALNVTGTAQGMSNDGVPVTLLTGNIVGGLFDGVPFANSIPAGASVQSDTPTAYVVNASGAFQINAFKGYAPLSQSIGDVYMVVAFSGIGSANIETSTCEEGVVQAFIHRPSS